MNGGALYSHNMTATLDSSPSRHGPLFVIFVVAALLEIVPGFTVTMAGGNAPRKFTVSPSTMIESDIVPPNRSGSVRRHKLRQRQAPQPPRVERDLQHAELPL